MDLIVLLWIWSAHQTAGGTPVVPLQLHLQATTSNMTVDDPVSSRGRYLVTKTKNSAPREGGRTGDLTKRAKPKRKPDFGTARARYTEWHLPGFGCAPCGQVWDCAMSTIFRPSLRRLPNASTSLSNGAKRNVMLKVRLGVESSEQADLHLPNDAPDNLFTARFDKPAERGTARSCQATPSPSA